MKTLHLAVCLYLLLINTAVYADDLVFIPSLNFFNYKEFNTSGVLLDEEVGLLPGIKIKYRYQNNILKVSPFMSMHEGKVNYYGNTQSGSPHNTETDTQLLTIGLDIGLQVLDQVEFTSGLRNSQWDRDILTRNNIRGLHEIYTWTELSAGLLYKSEDLNKSYYSLNLSVLYILQPEMKIYLENSSEILSLGERPGARMIFSKLWALQDNSLRLNLITEYWKFGRSNTVFTNDFFGSSVFITEPESESLHTRVELVYGSSF